MANKGIVDKRKFQETEQRPIRLKKYQYLFLIICEDEKTEPLYFENFRAKFPYNTLYLQTVGTGKDPKGVVLQAIIEKNKLAYIAKKEVDEVWVVFDKDDANENDTKIFNFHEAFKIAKKEKFEVAYSNEVFELWLLLHLKNIDGVKAISRNEIYELLSSQIKKTPKYSEYEYDHKRPNPKTIEIILEIGDVNLAIQRAKVLFEKQKETKPIYANPSTKVHLLVQKLNELIEYYNFKL
jgi:RloB-like protein